MYADKDVVELPYRYDAAPDVRCVREVYVSSDGPGTTGRRLSIGYYEAKAREIQSECIHKLLDAVARKVYGFARGSVVKAVAGTKRRRAIASTARQLFVLEDSTLRDIGIERSDIWSMVAAAVDEAAGKKRFKDASQTVPSKSRDPETNEEPMPMAA